MQNKDPKELLNRYRLNQCSEEEIAYLESWYLDWNKDLKPSFSDGELLAIGREMFLHIDSKKSKTKLLWPKLAGIAAVLALFIGLSFYFLNNRPSSQTKFVTAREDVMPGGNRAILKLANGKVYDLSKVSTGQLANDGKVVIRKTKEGQLIYDLTNNISDTNSERAFNTIQTPRAGTYQVILPDGTAVWLNSASTIKFPTSFAKNERKVELIGEAYFEVTENRNRPFRVVTAQQVVEVLGTHFNVNSYEDEPLQLTTLLKGSVKVTTTVTSKIIKPGEQAQIRSKGTMDVVQIDTNPVVAWKDGVFSFKKADLKTVMRQIGRWYDVDVEYGSEIPNISFTGKIYRNISLQEALKSIGYLDVKYTLKDRMVSFDTNRQ